MLSATGCAVTYVRGADGPLDFDRLGEGWPINFGTFGALNFRFVPFHSELGRYFASTGSVPARTVIILSATRYFLTAPFTCANVSDSTCLE